MILPPFANKLVTPVLTTVVVAVSETSYTSPYVLPGFMSAPKRMTFFAIPPKYPINICPLPALEAAVKGDMKPFNELLEMLLKPYENHPDEIQFQQIPNDFDEHYQTFCGT